MSVELLAALMETPFFVVTLLNVLAILKRDLLNIGFTSFSVIALVANPGKGKTECAKACLKNKIKYTFHQFKRVSDIQEELLGLANEAILLDDYAEFKSYYQKQKASRYIDTLVRTSFEGDGALMVITAESRALQSIPDSSIDRMFLISMENFFEDKQNKRILTYLQESKELQVFLSDMRSWYQEQPDQKEYMQGLLKWWRIEKAEVEPRTQSMVFSYYLAMRYVQRFCEERYGVQIDETKITENCNYLLQRRIVQKESEPEIIKMLLDKIFIEDAFKIVSPYLFECCERYCKENCTEAKRACFANEEFCSRDYDGYLEELYLPQNLLLPNDVSSALLIERPSKIFQFPRHIVDKPLLVVRDNILCALINSELEKYCIASNTHIPRITQRGLHKYLFENNLCLYRSIDNKHKCYNFLYLNQSLQSEMVVFLRIKDKQYLELAKKSEKIDISDWGFSYGRISNILGRWKKTFGNMYALAGAIGELGEDEHDG